MAKKSCYVVELAVAPGGARHATYEVVTSKKDLKRVISAVCRDFDAIYLITSYGAYFNLLVVERGKRVAVIDLHPVIRVQLGTLPPFRMEASRRFVPEGIAAQVGAFWDEYETEPEARVSATPQWRAVDIPTLSGARLRDGEAVRVPVPWLEDDDKTIRLGCGYNDEENGEHDQSFLNDDDWADADDSEDEDGSDDEDAHVAPRAHQMFPRHPVLEAAIREAPTRLEGYEVYGDWIAQRDATLGDMILAACAYDRADMERDTMIERRGAMPKKAYDAAYARLYQRSSELEDDYHRLLTGVIRRRLSYLPKTRLYFGPSDSDNELDGSIEWFGGFASKLQSLSASKPQRLAMLRWIADPICQFLRELFISGVSGVEDIGFLSELTVLEGLSMEVSKVADFTPLAALHRLAWLDLEGSKDPELAPLAALSGLRTLELSDGRLANLDSVGRLSGLQELSLRDVKVRDYNPLRECVSLQSVSLWSPCTADLSVLAQLPRLSRLSLLGLGRRTEVGRLEAVASLVVEMNDGVPPPQLVAPNAQALNVTLRTPSRIDHWGCGEALASLTVHGTTPDLEGLASLSGLEELDLSVDDFDRLHSMPILPRLKRLTIPYSCTSLAWLPQLDALEEIALRDGRLQDIEPLERLPKLRRVTYYDYGDLPAKTRKLIARRWPT